MDEVSLAWGPVNSLAKRFVWGNWGYEEPIYGALSTLFYLWDSEEQRDGEERRF